MLVFIVRQDTVLVSVVFLIAANKASVIDEPVRMEYWWHDADRGRHFAYSKLKLEFGRKRIWVSVVRDDV